MNSDKAVDRRRKQ